MAVDKSSIKGLPEGALLQAGKVRKVYVKVPVKGSAKEFVRDNIDVDILEDLLSLGGLGIQYCIKSEAAYANLKEITDELLAVDYTEFNDRYNQRDITARKRMRELVDSDANTVTKVFSTLFER